MSAPRCERCGAKKLVRVREAAPGKVSRVLYCPCRHRADSAAWIRRNPEKRAAHRAVEWAIKRGSLKPAPCEVCGGVAEAHHEDYSAPLDVTWLCRKHHVERHKQAARG